MALLGAALVLAAVPSLATAAPLTRTVPGAARLAPSVLSPREAGDRYAGYLPKNVIVMISDGGGFETLSTAEAWRYRLSSAEAYRSFPVALAMSTHSADSRSTDSAAAATAMSSGVKTVNGSLGIDANGRRVEHLVERAEAMGKATGVVTTVEWSHATPAGFVAHARDRGEYSAVARQMVASRLEVLMGAGNPFFDDDCAPRSTAISYSFVGGIDTWSAIRHGQAGGDADGDGVADPWKLIQSRQEFQGMASGRTAKRVLGTFQAHHTAQEMRSGDDHAGPYAVPRNAAVPTLSEMSMAALNVLDNDTDGFVLMVEGGAVDWAAHGNEPGRLIEEQLDFNDAVAEVTAWIDARDAWDDTLLVVTADHETGYVTAPLEAPWLPAFGSTHHTASLVPVYAKGAGSRLLMRAADQHDGTRGFYLDNTELGRALKRMR